MKKFFIGAFMFLLAAIVIGCSVKPTEEIAVEKFKEYMFNTNVEYIDTNFTVTNVEEVDTLVFYVSFDINTNIKGSIGRHMERAAYLAKHMNMKGYIPSVVIKHEVCRVDFGMHKGKVLFNMLEDYGIDVND